MLSRSIRFHFEFFVATIKDFRLRQMSSLLLEYIKCVSLPQVSVLLKYIKCVSLPQVSLVMLEYIKCVSLPQVPAELPKSECLITKHVVKSGRLQLSCSARCLITNECHTFCITNCKFLITRWFSR